MAAAKKSIVLAPKYIVLFLLVAFFLFSGVLINNVSPGVVLWGGLDYGKYLALFLLPAVYSFTEDDIEKQLRFVFLLALLQVPIAFFQRLVQFKGVLSGDVVSGTLIISSALSIFLISVISVFLAFYLRNRVARRTFFIYVVLLFLPTTINETKGTLILLPIALIIPVMFLEGVSSKFRRMVPVMISGVILIMLFVPMYDTFMKDRFGESVFDIVTDKDRIAHYLYSGEVASEDYQFDNNADLTGQSFNELERDAPRLDSMLIPLIFLSDEPIKLMAGLGIGNLNESRLQVLTGDYFVLTELYSAKITTVSQILWETGLGGLVFALVFLYMVLSDARYLRFGEGVTVDLALGWCAVVIIILVVLPYKNLTGMNVIGYLFSFYSGYLAASCYREKLKRLS